jgi:hypothetical protein
LLNSKNSNAKFLFYLVVVIGSVFIGSKALK